MEDIFFFALSFVTAWLLESLLIVNKPHCEHRLHIFPDFHLWVENLDIGHLRGIWFLLLSFLFCLGIEKLCVHFPSTWNT